MFLRCPISVLEIMLVEVLREAAYITFVYLISSLLSSLSSGLPFLLGANPFLCHPALLHLFLFHLSSLNDFFLSSLPYSLFLVSTSFFLVSSLISLVSSLCSFHCCLGGGEVANYHGGS